MKEIKSRATSLLLAGLAVSSYFNGQTSEASELKSCEVNSPEYQLMQDINTYRYNKGLTPLSEMVQLDKVAEETTEDMAQHGYFSHTSPTGETVFSRLQENGVSYRFAGEIMGRNNAGIADTENVVFDAFLASPHHEEIINDPQYSRIGIGFTPTPEGMNYFDVIFINPLLSHNHISPPGTRVLVE